MSKFLKPVSFAGLTLVLPLFALAEQVGSIADGFQLIIDMINNYVIPLIIGLAVVYFLWGVLKYVTAGGDEEKKGQGRDTMIYGIIAIFVMVSVWGLVNVLGGTFQLTGNNQGPNGNLPQIPQ